MSSSETGSNARQIDLPPCQVRQIGLVPYDVAFRAMQDFTSARGPSHRDEVWLLEHPPVFTQGQAGKPEHLLRRGDIPLVQSDRGGQITYHGPGQLVVYLLLDLRRLSLGPRAFVDRIECSIVQLLEEYGISAAPRADAPGVYVDGAKIASLGLRIRRGCAYHGLALNIDMDLEPFSRINPCGYAGLPMTQLADRIEVNSSCPPMLEVARKWLHAFSAQFPYAEFEHPLALQPASPPTLHNLLAQSRLTNSWTE